MVNNSICALWSLHGIWSLSLLLLLLLLALDGWLMSHFVTAHQTLNDENKSLANNFNGHNNATHDLFLFDFESTDTNMTDCAIEGRYPEATEEDNKRCHHIWQFEEDVVKNKSYHELISDIRYCACQLVYKDEWVDHYNHKDIARLGATVRRRLAKARATGRASPDYLWSDVELVVREVSILSSTRDFFYQQKYNIKLVIPKETRRNLFHDPLYRLIEKVCERIARDPDQLYGRLENILRLNPMIFYNTLSLDPLVHMVHDASRACKLMLKSNLPNYRLRADQSNYILIKDPTKPPDSNSTLVLKDLDSSKDPKFVDNTASTNISTQLSSASAALLACDSLIGEASKIANIDLAERCPVMTSNYDPRKIMAQMPRSERELSLEAIRCGCLLLSHKSTFAKMMANPDVQVMSQALINHMNKNQVPDFSNTPIWALYGWFNKIVDKFVNNRKLTINEVLKELSKSEDPVVVETRQDYIAARDLCRKACNFIVFNYQKGNREDRINLLAVKYLDNLQTMTRDPMFVFHLTLQDANLFKLYAVSKLCQPFVK